MEYTKCFSDLRSVFDPGKKEMLIPGSEVSIVNLEFESRIMTEDFSNKDDIPISENTMFTYPVFVPSDKKSRKVILLLHGLNERSWIKYLVWAFSLSQSTGSYVILFPISFHINRSPESWSNPREMMPFVKERTLKCNDIRMSSFANVTLSNRLTQDPMRFFNSGYQTATDILSLMNQIKDGKHQLIPGGSNVNIFSYSIGAFLSQILMIGNPENLFSDSRLFILCGGSVFSNMQGTSKLIMDSLAYEKIYNFYLYDFEKRITGKNPLFDFLRTSQVGIAFRSMIDFAVFRQFRENILEKLKDQIRIIAFAKDMVIPSEGIIKTMTNKIRGKNNNLDIWDFPYPYSHENPFPVFENHFSSDVDRSFDRVFSEAGQFLA